MDKSKLTSWIYLLAGILFIATWIISRKPVNIALGGCMISLSALYYSKANKNSDGE